MGPPKSNTMKLTIPTKVTTPDKTITQTDKVYPILEGTDMFQEYKDEKGDDVISKYQKLKEPKDKPKNKSKLFKDTKPDNVTDKKRVFTISRFSKRADTSNKTESQLQKDPVVLRKNTDLSPSQK